MDINTFWAMYGVSYVVLLGLVILVFPVLNEIIKRKLLSGKKSSAFWYVLQLVEIVASIFYVDKCPDLGLFLTGWWLMPLHVLACIVLCAIFNVYVIERIFKAYVHRTEKKLKIDIDGDGVIGKRDNE